MSDDGIINQMKLKIFVVNVLSEGHWHGCSPRDNQSSILVLNQSTSARRLLVNHKTRVFIAKKWWEIMCGGVYDVTRTALWW